MERILFGGDIMPGGVLPYQSDYVSKDVLAYLRHHSLRIVTLETAVGDGIPFDEIKMSGLKNIIYCRPKDIYRLKELNINAVSLANNHVCDMGTDGLSCTMNELDKNNIVHFGAGMNIEEASRPAVLKIANKTVAIFAYCQTRQEFMGYVPIATETSAGVNPLDISRCENDIRQAKKIYDYVFIMPHWGKEYEHFPLPEIVDYSKRMIRAGADGVFGSHTHQIQPMVMYKGKPIVFSMGNFLFPDYYMEPPRPLWYPSKDCDTSGFDRFEYYPGKIDKPCVQIWRPVSRIGMVVSYDLNNNKNIAHQYKLLILNNKNILCTDSDLTSMQRRMKWMGLVTMMHTFPILRRLYYSKKNVVRRGYHYLSRKL